MITEMRDPNAIYLSLFVAVVTVPKGHNKAHYTRLGRKKKLIIALLFFYLLPQKSSNWFEN